MKDKSLYIPSNVCRLPQRGSNSICPFSLRCANLDMQKELLCPEVGKALSNEVARKNLGSFRLDLSNNEAVTAVVGKCVVAIISGGQLYRRANIIDRLFSSYSYKMGSKYFVLVNN